MNARRLPLLALPLVGGALMALAIAAPATAATESVTVEDNSFDPSLITIDEGDTVAWSNEGSNPHTVTGDGFDSGSMAPGDDYSHTFASAGTFDYVCEFHPGMEGQVVVRAAGTGAVEVEDESDSGAGLATTGSSGTGATTGVAVAMVALGMWLIDMQRIRSARHRTR